jgi:hypothetical protein
MDIEYPPTEDSLYVSIMDIFFCLQETCTKEQFLNTLQREVNALLTKYPKFGYIQVYDFDRVVLNVASMIEFGLDPSGIPIEHYHKKMVRVVMAETLRVRQALERMVRMMYETRSSLRHAHDKITVSHPDYEKPITIDRSNMLFSWAAPGRIRVLASVSEDLQERDDYAEITMILWKLGLNHQLMGEWQTERRNKVNEFETKLRT